MCCEDIVAGEAGAEAVVEGGLDELGAGAVDALGGVEVRDRRFLWRDADDWTVAGVERIDILRASVAQVCDG